MQLITKHREVSTGGTQESGTFDIAHEHHPHIKRILRSSIYSDKVLAVLREYSANAWDAHRMSGQAERPIKVRLPTAEEPSLLIEDYGPGLSKADVFGVFTKYGVSTKRGTNDAVGMLGIGSKSGFCYSDTFTVTSRHGGTRSTYVAFLDEDENDSMNLMGEEPWDGETGLTIQIAVRKGDFDEFGRKAQDLFQYFYPRPDINLDLPPIPEIQKKLQHGIVFERGQYNWRSRGEWTALMGCVAYRIDTQQLRDSDGKSLISDVFEHTSGLAIFPVGSMQISASRESLEYGKVTNPALVQKFSDLLDEYVRVSLAEIETGDQPDWEKRLRSQHLLQLGLSEKEIGKWGQDSIRIHGARTFEADRAIRVERGTHLIRRTDTGEKDLRGYNIERWHQVLIKPREITRTEVVDGVEAQVPMDPPQYYPWQEVEPELQQFISENRLTGIQVVNLHELPWEAPYQPPVKTPAPKRQKGPSNPKHSKRAFRLAMGDHTYAKLSDNWEIVDRVPTPQDVYVVIREFQVADLQIYQERRLDARLAKLAGLGLPELYGYKTSEKRPLDLSKVQGIPYLEWREQFRKQVRDGAEVRAILEDFHWNSVPGPVRAAHSQTRRILGYLEGALGRGHRIHSLLAAATAARREDFDDVREPRKIQFLQDCGVVPPNFVPEAARLRAEIRERYPLVEGDLAVFWGLGERSMQWRRYVRLVDADLAKSGK